MATIEKKIWPEYFDVVVSGKKRFELRLADFSAQSGDTLRLREWNPETKEYTGREIEKKISFMIKFDPSNSRLYSAADIQKHGLYIFSLE